ncbi:glycerophosphodiester phosphodiesterase [Bowmanella dokdonensis]|uniref:glycerophosphodiester phosphodiesterase n=1 Tax=Bowmanella dokdonensis TaxID=751969 RepID=A0A939DM12_9ALTE|nr:glycerophosphodiester phosphodiesterase [Bowmanella dokdonensis]MBN7824948.1 glycerophosphodiester phosphodiesterase [Bowmanella dokdonensis]
MTKVFLTVCSLLICASLSARPLVIAHRGASAYLPEHTLEAAVLAHGMNADYIEQDLVLSKDGVPVVLHDIHLETVTDVEQRFPKRAREDGRYYAIDFTLAELKTLRVHERTDTSGRQVYTKRYPGQSPFQIATFEEQIELISALNRTRHRQTGLYPEIKSPAFHRREGLDISKIVLALLDSYGLNHPGARVYLQCFDYEELKRLKKELGAHVMLVQLIGENGWQESATDYDWLISRPGLEAVARIADGIGPWIPQLLDSSGRAPSSLLLNARELGLSVHPYTFRSDQLPSGQTEQQHLELLLNQLQVDGLFTDFPDRVVAFISARAPND